MYHDSFSLKKANAFCFLPTFKDALGKLIHLLLDITHKSIQDIRYSCESSRDHGLVSIGSRNCGSGHSIPSRSFG